MKINLTEPFLESLYRKYNKRKYVEPDPLQFLYDYTELKDREIAGLIASCLAYGQVKQILKSVSTILRKFGKHPQNFILETSSRELHILLDGFKHRFTTGEELAILLSSAKSAIEDSGSLQNLLISGLEKGGGDFISAQEYFVKRLASGFKNGESYLLPAPSNGSPCKRLNLYLRWMIRCDDVDPGGWNKVPKSKLLIPLDTHMWNICRQAGFTERRQANLKAALEITGAFAKIRPDDPVRYDFSLTRFGIRDELEIHHLASD